MFYLSYLCLFGSSLPTVVCRREHVFFYVICVCILVSNTFYVVIFCFVCLSLVYSMLQLSLDCSFLIAHTDFSNVYALPM